MDQLVSAVIGALGLAAIAFIGWLAPRVTRKGRLLGELRRLGEAYSSLPEGKNKASFASYIDEIVGDLVSWLDPINRRRRQLQNAVTWVLYFVGLALYVVAVLSVPDESVRGWIGLAVFAPVGAVLVLSLVLVELESARRKRVRDQKLADEASKQRIAELSQSTGSRIQG